MLALSESESAGVCLLAAWLMRVPALIKSLLSCPNPQRPDIHPDFPAGHLCIGIVYLRIVATLFTQAYNMRRLTHVS
jgi:hypothetical protein